MAKVKRVLALILAALLFLSNMEPLYVWAENSDTTGVVEETTVPVTEIPEESGSSQASEEPTVTTAATEPAETMPQAAADDPEPSQGETEETTAPAEETVSPEDTQAHLVEELETAIGTLPQLSEFSEAPEDFSGVLAQLDQVDALLQELAAFLEEDGDPLTLLSEDAQTRYREFQAFLSALAEAETLEEKTWQAELADIEQQIFDLPKAEADSRLGEDDYITLQDKFERITLSLEALKKRYPGYVISLSSGAQEAYNNAQNTLALGPATPVLSLLPGLKPTMNEESTTLKFQWNDHGSHKRPGDPVLGVGLPDESADMTVMVKDGDELVSLYDFYNGLLGTRYGYDAAAIKTFAQSMNTALGEPYPDALGAHINLTWDKDRLLTGYTDESGKVHKITYQLAPAKEKMTGENPYLLTQGSDLTTVIATPTRGFQYNVVWYDNHNNYDDNGQKARPTPESYTSSSKTADGKEIDGLLQVIRIRDGVSGSDEILEAKPFHPNIEPQPVNPGDMGETWAVSLSELPIYSPSGETYSYWVRQTSRKDGNVLNTTLSTGAYYTQEIVSSDLLDGDYPNAIKEGSSVYNILSRQGKIIIYKVWEGGNAASRPNSVLHFYREVEPDVVTTEKAAGSDEENVIYHGFDGSPVAGYDSCAVDKTKNKVTITVPAEKDSYLPMFDPFGRRYIYYCVETMTNAGDYETVIDNSKGGPVVLPSGELNAVRENASNERIILNGSTVTNRLRKQIRIPVEVDFKAQAIQNDMDNTTVELQLQYKKPDGTWANYEAPDYDGKLRLGKSSDQSQFHPETMTAQGESELVEKYDADGNPYEYRWVQTEITVSGGTNASLPEIPDSWEDPDTEVITVGQRVPVRNGDQEVGPGVFPDKTTLMFDMTTTTPRKEGTQVITNILVGDVQVAAKKTWTYIVKDEEGNSKTYSTDPDPNDPSIIPWDGHPLEDVPGMKWPNELPLEFAVIQNGKPLLGEDGKPVTVSMPAGQYEAYLGGLPRYDENGNEYSYLLEEINPGGSWASNWEHSASVVEENDIYLLRKTSSFENAIGPGSTLTFESTKHWLDDTDLETRRPVEVGVFRLDEPDKPISTTTLTAENNYNAMIQITAKDENDTVENYILKEISMDGISVVYDGTLQELQTRARNFFQKAGESDDYFISHRYDDPGTFFTPYRSGTLAMDNTDPTGRLIYQYNIYLSAEIESSTRADYHLYNQRTADMTVQLNKIWINDGQASTATFELYRCQDGKLMSPHTLTAKNQDGQNTASYSFTGLPKYDALGVLYEYELKEVSMTVDGMKQEAFFEDGAVIVPGNSRPYRYVGTTVLQEIYLAQTEWNNTPEDERGSSPHYSGDIYTWQSTNTRQNTKTITIHKVWRDGAGPQNTQDPVTRPDISFHLYRISHADLRALGAPKPDAGRATTVVKWMEEYTSNGIHPFASEETAKTIPGVQRQNGNVFWNTSTATQESSTPRDTNNWHWECDIAQSVPLYDENGSPYVYFIYEYTRGNAFGYEAHYDNTPGDLEKLASTAGTTEGTFRPLPEGTASAAAGEKEYFEDSSFLMVVDGVVRNDAYPCIVVNTRKRDALISGQKAWDFGEAAQFLGSAADGGIPSEDMPDLKLTLWRDTAKMVDDDDDGNYTFVPARWNLAETVEKYTVAGKEHPDYRYEFLDWPRYDEYGYRYSYWLTEEKVTSYESDNTLLGSGETGEMGVSPPTNKNEDSSFDANRGNFDITNIYKVQPPYVTISMAKTWTWPPEIINAKKSFTATFELYGVIVNEKGEKIGTDQLFSEKTLTVQVQDDGKMYYTNDEGNLVPYPTDNSPVLTFTGSNAGNFAGKNLPFYAPNGRPYQWYIKETANGYVVEDISADPITRAAKHIFNWFKGTEDGADPNFSDLILPTEDADGNFTATVTLKNTYDGGGTDHPLNIRKEWQDKYPGSGEALAYLRPDKIQVKLYRQWNVGGKTWAWEQVTKPDDGAIVWDQMNADGILTLSAPADNPSSSVWTLGNALTGLYRYAPNGKLYEYFVVEQAPTGMPYHSALSPDAHPDVGSVNAGAALNTTQKMARRAGCSGSVTLSAGDTVVNIPLTNKLLTKSLTVNKKWQKQQHGETTVSDLTVEDAKELNSMGGLPQAIHFFVQYSLDGTDWYYMPADLNAFKGTGVADWNTVNSSIASYQHVTVTMAEYINNNMDVPKTVSGLPAYRKSDDGPKEISYRWVEVTQGADGALTPVSNPPAPVTTSAGSQPVVETISQTFTNTVKVQSLTLRKIWLNDNANRDDTRPQKITLTVMDKKTGKRFQVELSQRHITDLTPYPTGDVYQSVHYVPESQAIADLDVTESSVSDYDYESAPTDFSLVDGAYIFTATNTLKSPDRAVIHLTAKKVWDEPALDSDWIKGNIRHEIWFTLQFRYWDSNTSDWTAWANVNEASTGVKTGDVTKKAAADADGNYIVTWENVYKYHDADGTAIARPIQYRVVETMKNVTGSLPYTVSGGTFGADDNAATVKNTAVTTQPTVTKLWHSADGKALSLEKLVKNSILPTHIRFAVYYKIGTGSTWTQLPNAFIDLSVKDDLLDSSYQPQACTVKNKFPKYDKTGGEISYELREAGIFYGAPGSTAMISVTDGAVGSFTVTGPVDGNGTVTNTLPVGSLTVVKKWDDNDNRDGIRPSEITVTLLRDDAVYDTVTLKADKDGNWAYTWNDLPVYQTVTTPGAAPEASMYTVQEMLQENGRPLLKGYDPAADSAVVTVSDLTLTDSDPTAELVNVHTPVTMSLSAKKKWDDQNNFYDLRPDSVQFKLQYKDGGKWVDVPYDADGLDGIHDVFFTGISVQYPGEDSTAGSQNKNGAVTLEEKDGKWPVVTWSGLPACANGKEIEYKVTEVNVPPCYSQKSATLTYSTTEKTVEVVNYLTSSKITVKKNWKNDQNNRYGTRPESLTFKLQSRIDGGDWADVLNDDGTPCTVTMAAPQWYNVSFVDLPPVDGEKNILYYRVEEITAVTGYTTPYRYRSPEQGIAEFTNELETVSLSVSKTWDDSDNRDGARPKSITIRLYADGKELSDHAVTVTAKENWRWSFQFLPKYRSDGTEVAYTVSEDPVSQYKSSIQGNAKDGFTVINRYTPSLLPKTGDDPRLLIYLGILLFSAGGLVGVGICLGKRKKKR